MSNKKYSASSKYLEHLQNTSPAKITYSFSKGSRFQQIYSQSPSRYYDNQSTRSKRSTSLGFGKKHDFVNKALMDPGLYQTKGQFDLIKSKLKSASQSTFGQSHENSYYRKLNMIKTPGPGQYHPDQMKMKSKFYMGTKLKHLLNSSQALKIGPQTYKVEESYEHSAKYKAIKSFRIKTQMSPMSKQMKQKFEKLRGPGAYNPEKLLSLQQMAKNKQIRGPASFGREIRMKTQNAQKLGPGSYRIFSVFGTDNNDF